MTDLPPIAQLDLAVVSRPDVHPEATAPPMIPVYGFVVDHPEGAIVFDTGVGFGNPAPPVVHTAGPPANR